MITHQHIILIQGVDYHQLDLDVCPAYHWLTPLNTQPNRQNNNRHPAIVPLVHNFRGLLQKYDDDLVVKILLDS